MKERNVMKRKYYLTISFIAAFLVAAATSGAAVHFQCPGYVQPLAGSGDLNGDGFIRADQGEIAAPVSPNEVCVHLAAGDGFATMADGLVLYIFSFSNITGVPDDMGMDAGMLGANSAPPIVINEGDQFYLTVTNVGMLMRPDLFDPHSVHFHGFPQAAPIFDGMPDSTITINMGASQPYYYNIVHPGTYFYHCHVEATEHMEMGMIGILYVRPAQDGTIINFGGRDYSKFAYNDVDGSTGYNVDYPIEVGGFDSAFHRQHIDIQPLPFAELADDYAMINGRGYPDTIDPNPLPAPAENGGKISQRVSSRIEATVGQRILLRISSVSVSEFYTIGVMGLPMQVVGKDARLLRGPTGTPLYYNTSSITLGGGETADVIVDTLGAAPGTYPLYTTNLNFLSNHNEDFGGAMTEIIITP